MNDLFVPEDGERIEQKVEDLLKQPEEKLKEKHIIPPEPDKEYFLVLQNTSTEELENYMAQDFKPRFMSFAMLSKNNKFGYYAAIRYDYDSNKDIDWIKLWVTEMPQRPWAFRKTKIENISDKISQLILPGLSADFSWAYKQVNIETKNLHSYMFHMEIQDAYCVHKKYEYGAGIVKPNDPELIYNHLWAGINITKTCYTTSTKIGLLNDQLKGFTESDIKKYSIKEIETKVEI